MPFPWQDTIAIALVAVAAAYLGFKAWRVLTRRHAGKCEGCGSSCAGGDTADAKPLVPVETLVKDIEQQ